MSSDCWVLDKSVNILKSYFNCLIVCVFKLNP